MTGWGAERRIVRAEDGTPLPAKLHEAPIAGVAPFIEPIAGHQRGHA